MSSGSARRKTSFESWLGIPSAYLSFMELSPTASLSSDAQQIAELARDVAHHAADLLRAEFALVKDELRNDLQIAKRRALSLAVSALLLQTGITLLALSFVLLWGARATAAFASGGTLVLMALGAALYGIRAFPRNANAITINAQRIAKAVT